MNRVVSSVGRRLSRLHISQIASSCPSTSQIGYIPPHQPRSETAVVVDINPVMNKTPWQLPAPLKNPKVYSFPTPNMERIRAPAPFIQELIEKFDPSLNEAPMEAPSGKPTVGMYAGPRMLTIRRKKMKKHKRRKRFNRDYFKYAKHHLEKKAKAEKAFRLRMKEIRSELELFNPEEYIKDIIRRAKREWATEAAPTGRKLYPHWSTLMSLEELYGLPKSDYIDKRSGLAGEEDRERIRQLRIQYYKDFCGEDIQAGGSEKEDSKDKEKQ